MGYTMTNIFGYFDQPGQEKPTVDPGLSVPCPFCTRSICPPMKTISLMRPESDKSFFYRAHKDCYEQAEAEEIQHIESIKIDAPQP